MRGTSPRGKSPQGASPRDEHRDRVDEEAGGRFKDPVMQEDESFSKEGEAPPSPVEDDWPLSARIGLCLGPALVLVATLSLALLPSGLEGRAQRLVAVTLWMAAWWMTEAVPMGATALLPLVFFPPMGILHTDEVASCYASDVSWLLFGGFQLASAVERTGLHRRLALLVLGAVGTSPPFLLLGIMLSVAALCMFLSNTGTTVMILPVAEALADSLAAEPSRESERFGKALMLGTAYAASMGGMGTLVGSTPNSILAAQGETFGLSVSFAQWAAFAAPLALASVVPIWVCLVACFGVRRRSPGTARPVQAILRQDVGCVSQAEVRVGAVFALTVLVWLCRRPLVSVLRLERHQLEDSTIAMAATLLLFIIPARDRQGRSSWLLSWQALLKTPWHVLLLLGGGLAVAKGFQETQLSHWVGAQLSVLSGLPMALVIFLVVLIVAFLTEATTNTATANVLLPIVGELARSLSMKPATLMVPTALASSCAFMLPVATAPNAIVYATGRIKMKDMALTGLVLNFFSAGLITAWMLTWGRLWFDIGFQ